MATIVRLPQFGMTMHEGTIVTWLKRVGDPVTEGEPLAEIETGTRRLVALRNWGVTGGAERLGITHGALSRWAKRRKIPTKGGMS